MVAVAIAGLILIGWVEGKRRLARFRELAMRYHKKVMNRSIISYSGHGSKDIKSFWRVWQARNAKPIAYYTEMTRKYEFAVRYPWLPVAPDPPEPK